jgi:hypothetical protein
MPAPIVRSIRALADDLVVVRVRPNPKPDHVVSNTYRQRPMVCTDPTDHRVPIFLK